MMAHLMHMNSTPPPTPNVIPVEILRDLVCRFTANIPNEERNNLTRICFQIELAHWLFVDHYCKPGDALHHLAHVPFNIFASLIFQMTPYLRSYTQRDLEQIINDFREYKSKVPTYGAILMNKTMSQVLLVQGFGNSWGFPKGKVNRDEEAVDCAIREVKEETGYDITPLVNHNHFIESNANDRNARLYLIVGVDTSFPFKPQTSYEIRQIGWFDINELPENKKDTSNVSNRGFNNSQFFTVFSFVKRLKRWIADKQSGANQINCFRCPSSSMRFPYSNDKRTIWEMESPLNISGQKTPNQQMTGGGGGIGGSGDHHSIQRPQPRTTAGAGAGRQLFQKPNQNQNQPTDSAKWAQQFQRVQHGQPQGGAPNKNQGGAAAGVGVQTAPAHHEKYSSSTGVDNKGKGKNVKRRLQFDEPKSAAKPSSDKNTTKNKSSTVGTTWANIKPDPTFFDGPGPAAWVNFTLSLNDFHF